MPPTTSSLTLSQLSDLALGTPEVGAVNFNCLHTLLNGMLKKLQIADTKVDIPEYQHKILAGKGDIDQESGVFSVHDEVDTASSVSLGSVAEKGNKSKISKQSTSSPYHAFESRISKLENEVKSIYDLPSNVELFRKVKKEQETQPVSDMWSFMRLEKRVDANEQGVGKLMSLMEDMMKQMNEMKEEQQNLKRSLADLQAALSEMRSDLGSMRDRLDELDALDNFVTWEGLENSLKGIRDSLDNLPSRPTINVVAQTDKVETVDRPVSARSSRPGSARGPSPELSSLLEQLGQLTKRFEAVSEHVDNIDTQVEELWDKKADKDALEGLSIPGDLLAQIAKLKSDVETLMEGREKDDAAFAKLRQSLLDLQEEVARLNSITKSLVEENNAKQKHIEAIYKLIENLQETKADKQDVEEQLSKKADKSELDSKVSRELFDSTMEEIHKLINELLTKLEASEDAWKQAYSKLASDLDLKADRLELDELKQYLEKRMKALERKLRAPTMDINPDDDAAILRSKMATRFNCLACDRNVDMNTNLPIQTLPDPEGFAAKQTARPYQVFELDQMRQLARSYGHPDVMTEYYAVRRACGGNHTLTYPHKRVTKVPAAYSEALRTDPDGGYGAREEGEIQGSDGRIYKTYDIKPGLSMSSQIAHLVRAESRAGGRPSTAASRERPRPTSAVTPRRPSTARASSGRYSRPKSAHHTQPQPPSRTEATSSVLIASVPDGSSEPEHYTPPTNIPSAELE